MKQYGLPRHGNPREPLSALIYLLLSNRSTAATAKTTYEQLRLAYPRWEPLLDAKIRNVQTIIKPIGLHRIRARQIRAILRAIRAKYDVCSLDELRKVPSDEAQELLESLPGVSMKLAKCVQMYTLNAKVLPVDVHVFRVSNRLGLINTIRPALSHEAVERVVPPRLRYTYHVTCLALGRDVCRSVPQCARCCIRRYCLWGSRG